MYHATPQRTIFFLSVDNSFNCGLLSLNNEGNIKNTQLCFVFLSFSSFVKPGDSLQTSSEIINQSASRLMQSLAAHSTFEMCWRHGLLSLTVVKGSFVVEVGFRRIDICQNWINEESCKNTS